MNGTLVTLTDEGYDDHERPWGLCPSADDEPPDEEPSEEDED